MKKEELEVSVVMPCLNEEKTVGICVEKAVKTLKRLGIKGEVVVSDNGSKDRSVAIAKKKGARVVSQPKRGYGNAYLKGFEEAKGKYIIMADSDDTYDFTDLKRFILPLREGYDMVMGTRLKGTIEKDAMPWLHKYIGNPFLSWFLRMLFKTKISDAHCGMRSFTKEAYKRMHLKTTGMEFASEMVINAAKAGLKIKEIPITLHANKDRRPHLNSIRDGWRHLRFMMQYSPYHLFFIPGLALLLAGIALFSSLIIFFPLQVGDAILGPNTAVLGSLLAITGFQVLLFGFFAKVHYFRISYFDRPKGTIKKINDFFTLEKGIFIAGILIAAGFIVNLFVLIDWIRNDLGELGLVSTIDTITGATLMILGIQLAFGSFLINILQTE